MKPQAKTILIIDDSKTYVMYVGLLLKRMGFDIITANSGPEGLTLLRALSPDAVLLDLVMPGMDGISVLCQIKEHRETIDIPVIISTMDNKEETRDKCFYLGCSAYLTKPVSVADLHRVLQEALPATRGMGRKYLRASYTDKVRTTHDGVVGDYYALSLSEGGIFLRKIDPLPVGTEVRVALPLDHGKLVELAGVVIYQREIFERSTLVQPGMAIQFNQLGPIESGLIKGFINQLLTADILDEQGEVVITP